jgi:hypothetical protein
MKSEKASGSRETAPGNNFFARHDLSITFAHSGFQKFGFGLVR